MFEELFDRLVTIYLSVYGVSIVSPDFEKVYNDAFEFARTQMEKF